MCRAATAQAHVDVWFWPLDAAPHDVEALSAILSADERARSDRFFHAQDRSRWIVARGRMRQALGGALDCAPADIAFSTEAHGRPFLVDAGPATPSFNLSHSDGLGALAVSFDARVGVDVEAVRPMPEADMVWPLSPAERASLASMEGAARFDGFFRYWTLKEAFIKAVGTGVSLPLEDFDISPPSPGEPRLLRLEGAADEPTRWRFAEHRPTRGYRAAVAALTDGRGLVVKWHGSCLARPI